MSDLRRSIVDAHHHLWDLEACHYPWLMADGVKRFFGDPSEIQRNYLIDEFRNDASDYELLASVHVQVGVAEGDEVKESDWLEGVANRHGLPAAIVAYCDLLKSSAPKQLEMQTQRSRLRGVRHIIGRSIEEDAATGSGQLVDDPQWRDNLRVVSELGLSFDLQLIPPQMHKIAELLSDIPDLKVALCHCGSPSDHSQTGRKYWTDGLRTLSSLPNVYCKISGFGMFDHHWTHDSIRPYIETCIGVFGASRTMFGSNFPVDKLHRSYAEIWQSYEAATAGLSELEQQLLFTDTAKNFYRL